MELEIYCHPTCFVWRFWARLLPAQSCCKLLRIRTVVLGASLGASLRACALNIVRGISVLQLSVRFYVLLHLLRAEYVRLLDCVH